MEFHPLADIFPMMSPEEYAALKADIAKHGLLDPIWTYENKIVDGRNRHKACLELEIEPQFREWSSDGPLTAFIVSMNLHRRHLSESQRAMVAAKLANVRQGERTDLEPNINLYKVSRADASQMMQVSVPSVAHAKKVLTEGTPKLVQAVERDKVAVSLAAKVVREPKEDQINFIRKVERGIKPSAAIKAVKQEAAQRERENSVVKGDPSVQLGDFRVVGQGVADDSTDLIFTDPPYNKESVQLYADLSTLARRVLKPGGLCVAYSGHVHLPDVLQALSSELEYMWTASIQHSGGQLRFRKYHIRNAFKPILIFYKPPLTVWWNWFSDVATGGKEKAKHEWQQAVAEAEHYIKALCPQGGLVLDPMCGSGTTLVAAKKLGMNYTGFDSDANAIKIARGRLHDA